MVAQTSKKSMKRLVTQNLCVARLQYKYLMTKIPPGMMPRSYDPELKKLITSKTSWWCSGFYPGTLWYLYENSGDTTIRREAEKRLAILEKEKNNSKTHDLGFMMFCSFGNAYRITGNNNYKEVLKTSASSLASRYRPAIKSIQSWENHKFFNCPVIIDNMMNLELLNWVSDNGGDKNLECISIHHANTTMTNHYRSDYSCYHVVDYDLISGDILDKKTWQGFSDSSSWSRGQAWGLYGFTTMYRYTNDKRYLKFAINIANFILMHPQLPADKIPYWDFDAPITPSTYRDASAAAIIASALLELGQYADKKQKKIYLHAASQMLQTLSSDTYLARVGENGGFLLKHSVGNLPSDSEVDVPLTYADYYFVEALMRYKKWYL